MLTATCSGNASVESARRAADQKRRLIARAGERGAGADIIDLTKIEELAEVIDLTSDLDGPGERRRTERSLGGDLLHRWVRGDGLALEIGTFVELEQPIAGRYPAEFFKVVEMVKSASGGVTLHGLGYARARHMEGMLARKMNEVCLLATVDDADPRPWDVQRQLISTRPSNIKRRRRLRTTNMAYPAHRYDVNEVKDLGTEWVADNCVLVCRYRYVEHFHGPATRKPCRWEFVRISEKEADERFPVSDIAVLNEWRGGKIRRGSYMPGGTATPVIDLESQLDGKLKLVPGQRYSAGDTFSGAGGAARGIKRAGLQLVFGIDNWGPAVVSLERNFPDADILDVDIHDFVRSPATQYRVDMLHLSPPCQVWSPAHTIAGKDDDMNMAAIYSCPKLITKVRPRLFTLEQTFGILHGAFSTYFNKLICGFANHSYSVWWKIVHLATYGLAQPRRRLIIIGAGPGEVLPSFPPPTHSESGTGGLLPLVTARQALAPLARRRLGDNRLHSVRKSKPLRRGTPTNRFPEPSPVVAVRIIIGQGSGTSHCSSTHCSKASRRITVLAPLTSKSKSATPFRRRSYRSSTSISQPTLTSATMSTPQHAQSLRPRPRSSSKTTQTPSSFLTRIPTILSSSTSDASSPNVSAAHLSSEAHTSEPIDTATLWLFTTATSRSRTPSWLRVAENTARSIRRTITPS